MARRSSQNVAHAPMFWSCLVDRSSEREIVRFQMRKLCKFVVEQNWVPSRRRRIVGTGSHVPCMQVIHVSCCRATLHFDLTLLIYCIPKPRNCQIERGRTSLLVRRFAWRRPSPTYRGSTLWFCTCVWRFFFWQRNIHRTTTETRIEPRPTTLITIREAT